MQRFRLPWKIIRRRVRFALHEVKCKWNGDNRDEFERYVDRCRILELSNVIENVAGIPDGGT